MFFLFSFLFLFGFSFFLVFSLLVGLSQGFYFEILGPVYFPIEFSFVFSVDFFSLMFFSAVSVIASMVFLYSKFYMSSSESRVLFSDSRFYLILFLFVLSMFFLVFSASWVGVLLGWDGLGLISFLLVIYYNNSSSLVSGLVTIFTNRIGDCFFILGFIGFFSNGWLMLDSFLYSFSFVLFFILFLGACTKSAQVPFSSWLPMAMAAPTPVSSLVHSSTLVTAGVYLFVRFNFLFVDFYWILSVLSLLTMFLGGLCATVEVDFKKVVAMSTLSQLGFMLFSLSIGLWELCFFHMVFHAYFKSALFLTTGNLMHYLCGLQDSRFFGSMWFSFFSKLFFIVSCLSLMGFPFTLGFFSKDLILGSMFVLGLNTSVFLFVVSCVFTVVYSLRLISLGVVGLPSFFPSSSFSDDYFFFIPVLFLFFLCAFSGNFFFFNFLPVAIFNFFESALGLLVILLGALTYVFTSYGFFSITFLSLMGFLGVLASSLSSVHLSLFPYKMEYSWSEASAAKGLGLFLSWVGCGSLVFFMLSFSSFLVFGVLFFFLF